MAGKMEGLEPPVQAFADVHNLHMTTHDMLPMSIAISLKRIADALDCSETGGKPQGTVLWWLETIASAANAGRS